jgi:hypothetical protein
MPSETIVGVAFECDGLVAVADKSGMEVQAVVSGVGNVDHDRIFDEVGIVDKFRCCVLFVMIQIGDDNSAHEYPLTLGAQHHLDDDCVVEIMQVSGPWIIEVLSGNDGLYAHLRLPVRDSSAQEDIPVRMRDYALGGGRNVMATDKAPTPVSGTMVTLVSRTPPERPRREQPMLARARGCRCGQ